MSTRSWILLKNESEFKGIYCHFDGYLVGSILKEHYANRNKVESLISLGDISFLDESIDKPDGHTFDNPIPGYTVAYHRDRGEEFSNIIFDNIYGDDEKNELIKYLKTAARKSGIEYVHIFGLEPNEWKSFSSY